MIAMRHLVLTASTLALPIAVFAADRHASKSLPTVAEVSGRNARSIALFLEMGKVIRSPRCVNCHPRTDRPLQGETGKPHEPAVLRGPGGRGVAGLECTTCHGAGTVDFSNGAGSIPGDPDWRLAPIEMAWEGGTLGDICRGMKDPKRNGGRTLQALVEHNAHDHLVGYGWHPGKGRPSAPGTQAVFGTLTQAWVDSGASCPR